MRIKSPNARTCKAKIKLRGASKALGNVFKSGLCILTTMETSYAKSQNAAKYHQCVDKIIHGITTWEISNPRILF